MTGFPNRSVIVVAGRDIAVQVRPSGAEPPTLHAGTAAVSVAGIARNMIASPLTFIAVKLRAAPFATTTSCANVQV
jgi:hypothetical protein